jgi:outer membrane protein assembly factor BamB
MTRKIERKRRRFWTSGGLVCAAIVVTSACTGGLGDQDDPGTPRPGAPASSGAVLAGAAGAPAPTTAGQPSGTTGAVPPGGVGAGAGGEVRFTAVFNEVLSGCAGFCHGGGALGMLDLSEELSAYEALVGIDAQGADMVVGTAKACLGSGVKRVVAGDAAASLLYQKLSATQACGTPMPPPPAELLAADKLDLVKRWIDGGALPGLPPTTDPMGPVAPTQPPPIAKPTMIEWPSFGPGIDNTRYNRAESKVGVENVGQLRELWTRNLSGGMNGIPALMGGVLYFTDYSGVHAASPETGQDIWTARIGQSQASPLVTADRVYASGGRSMAAFDRMTGRQIWAATLNNHGNTTIISAPVLAGDVIVIGVAGNELASSKADYTFVGWVKGLNKDTGAILWQLPVSGAEVAEVTGSAAGNGVSVWSSAAVDTERKLAFIGTGNAYEEPAGELSDALLAIRYETGELAWHNQFSMNDVYVSVQCPSRNCKEDFDIGASPNLLVVDGVDAVAVGSKGGIFKVINRDTGEDIWKRDVSEETGSGAAGGIMTTAAIGENMIYTNSNQWLAHGFRRTGAHDPMDTSTSYGFDLRNGETIWSTKLPAPAIGMALLANGVVYQVLINGAIYGLNAETGEILWEGENIGHDLAPGFNMTDGVLYGGGGGTWWVGSQRPGASISAYALP